MIRRAHVADVPALGKLINDAAEYGLMLPRSMGALYENVRDYHVALDEQDEIVGVCGLGIVWANLAEVYALVVAPDQRGKGLGRQLVQACIDEAHTLGIRRLMTLTYEKAFFEKLGFSVVDRQRLPLKVWSECVRCPKNQACDEIAMIRELTDVPEVSAPQPQAPPTDEYVIPLTLSAKRRHAALPPVEGD
ncbi:MAG: N-acetyltransferase [Phycisphaeraceae bacterium]